MKNLVQILTENDVYLDPNKWQHFTDKELHCVGGHKYCSTFYDAEFSKFQKKENLKFLEIGVLRGGSLCLWNEYFINPEIVGIDIIDRTIENPDFSIQESKFYNTKRIFENAYTKSCAENFKDYDIILDDGSHTFYDQCEFIRYYPKCLTKGGICIIEDIQSPDYIQGFISLVDLDNFKYKIIDTREEVGIKDNLLFVIEKL